MFHLKNGLYFERLDNGSVRILKRSDAHPDSPVVMDETMDSASFASAVCAASKDQEMFCQWYAVMEILSGKFSGAMEEYRKQKEGFVQLLKNQGYHAPSADRCSKCHNGLG